MNNKTEHISQLNALNLSLLNNKRWFIFQRVLIQLSLPTWQPSRYIHFNQRIDVFEWYSRPTVRPDLQRQYYNRLAITSEGLTLVRCFDNIGYNYQYLHRIPSLKAIPTARIEGAGLYIEAWFKYQGLNPVGRGGRLHGFGRCG